MILEGRTLVQKDLEIIVECSLRLSIQYTTAIKWSNKILGIFKGDAENKMLSFFLLQIMIHLY